MPITRLNARAGKRVVAAKHMFVAAAAVVVVGTSAGWNNAAAQQSPAAVQQGPEASANIQRPRDSTANVPLRLEAPVGHRQPRADDLPASVLRDEERPPAGNPGIDRDLRICRNC
jgi:hypothetical protein